MTTLRKVKIKNKKKLLLDFLNQSLVGRHSFPSPGRTGYMIRELGLNHLTKFSMKLKELAGITLCEGKSHIDLSNSLLKCYPW